MDNPPFGARVRVFRLALGMSQQDLAERVGLTRSSIANLESGRQEITVPRLVLLAQVLKVRVADLVGAIDGDGFDVVARVGAENGLLREENKILRERIRYAFEAVTASEGEAEE